MGVTARPAAPQALWPRGRPTWGAARRRSFAEPRSGCGRSWAGTAVGPWAAGRGSGAGPAPVALRAGPLGAQDPDLPPSPPRPQGSDLRPGIPGLGGGRTSSVQGAGRRSGGRAKQRKISEGRRFIHIWGCYPSAWASGPRCQPPHHCSPPQMRLQRDLASRWALVLNVKGKAINFWKNS